MKIKEMFKEDFEVYGYIVIESRNIVLEVSNKDGSAPMYAKAFGGKYYDHVPNEEYGYEDQFNFINDWNFMTIDNYRLRFCPSEDGTKLYAILQGEVYDEAKPF